MRSSERILPSQRIRAAWVFKLIFENAVFIRGTALRVWAYHDTESRFKESAPQIGIIVSRKTHANATVRNLWKRRIRESFRKLQDKIKPKHLILVASRRGGKEVPRQGDIAAELEKLLVKAGTLK